MTQSVAIIGGDQRQVWIAELLAKQNLQIYCIGFEKCQTLNKSIIKTKNVPPVSLILLPIPVTRNEKEIVTGFADHAILPNDITPALHNNVKICGGLIPAAWSMEWQQRGATILDYGKLEEFELLNAVPSAEGAIQVALENTEYTLDGAKVCVVGYGRIGKALTGRLLGLGCQVTATARKANDLIAISQTDATAVHTDAIQHQPSFDVLFNTVPAPVIDKAVLDAQTPNTLVIDLASKPGGVDFGYAQEKRIRCIHALSLPAKCAPLTAAKNILKVINRHFTVLEEEL